MSIELDELDFILNGRRGNPYHDKLGRFATGPGGSNIGLDSIRSAKTSRNFRTGDDIEYDNNGTIIKGVLRYDKDSGKFYIEQSNGEKFYYDKFDFVKTKLVKTKEEKQLEALQNQGIVHKSPKERRTERQKQIIQSLSDMSLLNDYEIKDWVSAYGDEDVLNTIDKVVKETRELGLDTENLRLERLKTGSTTWGKGGISYGKYVIRFVGQMLDGNPMKLAEITKDSERFHTADSVEAVVRHEVGHVLSYYIANNGHKPSNLRNEFSDQVDKAEKYCYDLVSEAMDSKKGWELSKAVENADLSTISKYGKKNYKEFVAEAWANPNYSLETKYIAQAMKDDLKRVYNLRSISTSAKDDKLTNKMNSQKLEYDLCLGYGPEEPDIIIEENGAVTMNQLKLEELKYKLGVR